MSAYIPRPDFQETFTSHYFNMASVSVIAPRAPVVSPNIPDNELTPEQRQIRRICITLCTCYDYLTSEEDDWDIFQGIIDDLEFELNLISKWSWASEKSIKCVEDAISNAVKACDAHAERNSIIYNKKYPRKEWDGTDEDYEIFKVNMLDEVDDYFELRERASKSLFKFLHVEFNLPE